MTTALGLVAQGAAAHAVVPVVNGDFSAGALNWTTAGDALIAGGNARLGIPACSGFEPFGYSGSITTQLPIVPLSTINLDYSITTSDVVFYDWLEIRLINAVTGASSVVGRFNPNPSLFVCATRTGHLDMAVPLGLQGQPAYLQILARQDGFGDPFGGFIDNIATS